MSTYRSTFKVFNESRLSDYLKQKIDEIKSRIDSKSDDYILGMDGTEDLNHLVKDCTVENIKIDFEGKRISRPYKKMIPAEHFPPYRFNVQPGRSYPKQAVTYYLPYTGNGDLFRYTPDSRMLWTTEVFLEDRCLCFEVFSFCSKPEDIAEDIKAQAEQIINDVKTQLGYLTSEVDGYNDQLSAVAKEVLQERKQRILGNNQIVELLELPIKE